MVLGGYDRVPCAGFLDQVRPGCRVVVLHGEALELLHVIGVADLAAEETPRLINPIDRIDSAVDEDPQLRVGEPLHFVFDGLGVDLGLGGEMRGRQH